MGRLFAVSASSKPSTVVSFDRDGREVSSCLLFWGISSVYLCTAFI